MSYRLHKPDTPKHLGWKKILSSSPCKNEKIFLKCAQNRRCTFSFRKFKVPTKGSIREYGQTDGVDPLLDLLSLKVGYNMDNMRLSARLVVNPITVYSYVFLFNSAMECQTSDLIQRWTWHKNSKWVWSGNTTITNRRQPRGTARKSRSKSLHPLVGTWCLSSVGLAAAQHEVC